MRRLRAGVACLIGAALVHCGLTLPLRLPDPADGAEIDAGGDADADTDADADGDADGDPDADGDVEGDTDTDADTDEEGDTEGDGDPDDDADVDADGDWDCWPHDTVVPEVADAIWTPLTTTAIDCVDRSGVAMEGSAPPVEGDRRYIVDGLATLEGAGVETLAWADSRACITFVFDLNACDCEEPDDCTDFDSAGILVCGVQVLSSADLSVNPGLGVWDMNLVDVEPGDCLWGEFQSDELGPYDETPAPQLTLGLEVIKQTILDVLLGI